MKYKLLFFLVAILLLFSATVVSAATTGLDWAFFKNYSSPAWVWGQNGLITIPIAETLGKGHIALSANAIDSGTIQGQQLYFVTTSLQIGTSSDVELGYTKKLLTWNGKRTDIEGETFHMKVKLLDISEFAPKVSVGTTAFALTNEDNYSAKDMFFNVFAVASQSLVVARLHLGYEFGLVGQATSRPFLFAGLDIPLGPALSIMGEYVGSDVEGNGGVSNAGLSIKLLENILTVSAAAANLGQTTNTRYMAQASVLF